MNYERITRVADETHTRFFLEMVERSKAEEGGPIPFPFADFDAFIRERLSVISEPRLDDEAKIGVLIAVAGAIQTYLHNEHGIAYSPRPI